MEGDFEAEAGGEIDKAISIHALRVEGDACIIKDELATAISIHALRVEGDKVFPAATANADQFLSTPSGWRATQAAADKLVGAVFLSTPSGWRATHGIQQRYLRIIDFYPRPPGGGRLCGSDYFRHLKHISIHALRVEGDRDVGAHVADLYISIHALRVEGDIERKDHP